MKTIGSERNVVPLEDPLSKRLHHQSSTAHPCGKVGNQVQVLRTIVLRLSITITLSWMIKLVASCISLFVK